MRQDHYSASLGVKKVHELMTNQRSLVPRIRSDAYLLRLSLQGLQVVSNGLQLLLQLRALSGGLGEWKRHGRRRRGGGGLEGTKNIDEQRKERLRCNLAK